MKSDRARWRAYTTAGWDVVGEFLQGEFSLFLDTFTYTGCGGGVSECDYPIVGDKSPHKRCQQLQTPRKCELDTVFSCFVLFFFFRC